MGVVDDKFDLRLGRAGEGTVRNLFESQTPHTCLRVSLRLRFY